MIHELKTDPYMFDCVATRAKTFELRKNDRHFRVGDILILKKTKYTGIEMANGSPLEYLGDPIIRVVTHMLQGPQYGLMEGWVILSLGRIEND